MEKSNETKRLKNCVCRNLRMTTRVTTQYYDQMFQSVELPAAQFSLLADISYRKNSTISELAEALLMDQTTVTRNVEILRKKGYVSVNPDSNDSRRKCVSISEEGAKKLNEAVPLWNEVQSMIENEIGDERFEEFLKTLGQIQSFISKVSKT
ncbi:MarR family winged helix-turn-helix transcriptional regulator [Clostridium intestinale]|nr:MarR family winged helix-turn-helix transcriptional regulator [Clostridium intestinale]